MKSFLTGAKIGLCLFACLVLGSTFVLVLILIKTVNATGTQVAEISKFINDDPRGIKGTFSNLNAILVQTGLAADEVRRASMTQRKYWDTISQETVESIHRTNEVLAHVNMLSESLNTTAVIVNRKTLPDANLVLVELQHTVAALGDNSRDLLKQSTASAAAAEKVLMDTDAVLTSPSVGKGLENFSAMTANLNQSAANVEKTTGYIADMFKPTKKAFWRTLAESWLPIGVKSLIPQRTVVINPVEVKK